jgi:hypothetical protein
VDVPQIIPMLEVGRGRPSSVFGGQRARVGGGMENPEREEREQTGRETTSPNEPTHEATTPPGNPDTDADAVKEAEKGLEQAGGGH